MIRIIASFLLLLGAVALAGLVWDIADMMQGFTNRMSGAFAANILQQGGDDDK